MKVCLAAFVVSLAFAASPVTSHIGARQPDPVLQAFDEGTGAPLIMLGGGTFGAVALAPHAQSLAKDFRVVRLQTFNVARGQKHEPLPAGYSVKLESGAMAKALDQLNLRGAVDIVGWSFGGLVALDFALDHPDRVHTLALAEPPAFWAVAPEEMRERADMRAMSDLTRELVPEKEPTDAQYVRFLCALGRCGAEPPAAGQPDSQDWAARRSALRGLSAVANHTDRVARLKGFRRPVLIMTGTDTVAFHRRINDILAANLPTAERVELTGGHTAPVAARDDFVAKLRAFLARHRAQ